MWCAEPSQGIQEADLLHAHMLERSGLPHDQADQVVDHGTDSQLLQHTWARCAVQHLHLHRGLEVHQGGFDLPAPSVPRGEIGDAVDLGIEPRRHEGQLVGPEPLDISSTSHQGRTVRGMRHSMYQNQDTQIRGVTLIQYGRLHSPLTETKL
jgi:hypothetical protein